jgi:hypothetical protein
MCDASGHLTGKEVVRMKKEIASQISSLMLEYGAKLDDSIGLVMETCSEEESKAYRAAVGNIMGSMLLDIMKPIYREHPDLKPDELR